MSFFWLFFYNLIVYPFLFILAICSSLFNKKIRTSLIGKLISVKALKIFFTKKYLNRKVYWFHASSLGEFFQIAPILEELKKTKPDILKIVSFSSPSGYNYVNEELFELKFYLPFDFIWTNKNILNIIKPDKIIFASYGIWPNLLKIAKDKKIKTILFSVRIHSKSKKLNPIIKSFYKMMYSYLNDIYTITDSDKVLIQFLLKNVKPFPTIKVLGNPRYDYVKNNFDKRYSHDEKNKYENRSKKIIIGSSHSSDNIILVPVLSRILRDFPEWKIIYAPHETTLTNIENIQSLFKKNGHESVVHKNKDTHLPEDKIVVIGTIGILANLYWEAKIAYIGGGFSSGIHNVLEPAIAELPIIFGPKYYHAPEAEDLIKNGGGFCIKNEKELHIKLETLIKDTKKQIETSILSKKVIDNNLGSAERITQSLLND